MISPRARVRSHHSTCPICSGPRAGVSAIDVLVILLVAGLAISLGMPALIATRDAARRLQCADNLRGVGIGLRQYHDTHTTLPPAAVWQPGSMASLMLNEAKRIDLVTRDNWAIMLLPHIGEVDLAQQFDRNEPIMSGANATPRIARPGQYVCPMDHFNRIDNAYAFVPDGHDQPLATLARGNYGINGGTHNPRFTPETAAEPRGDGLEMVLDSRRREFQLVGSGIAGINRAFRMSEFENGQSTLVAIEELRAGIHPLDPRGVWSLGQIGGSITWGHGVAGDAGCPNNRWVRSDDILGCGRLHETVGSETLAREQMPCVDYVDRNDQVASRSLHEGGVNVLFLDGRVRFIQNEIDAGVWHVMHSRETPASILADDLEIKVSPVPPPTEAPPRIAASDHGGLPSRSRFENSLGMAFVVIPAGEFQMGTPDLGKDAPPPECRAHLVRITHPYHLGQHEVTRAEFRKVLRTDPVGDAEAGITIGEGSLPQTNVSWDEANEFCRRLSSMPAESDAGRSYRLPTEAEWEYACRSGKSVPFRWARDREPQDGSGENARKNPSLPLTAVGSYPPNEFGVFDMRGNAWEWCSDWFDRTYYYRSPIDDPQGPVTGYVKVVRGGDWIFVGEPCQINYTVMPPWKKNPFVGFRVVCEVP